MQRCSLQYFTTAYFIVTCYSYTVTSAQLHVTAKCNASCNIMTANAGCNYKIYKTRRLIINAC